MKLQLCHICQNDKTTCPALNNEQLCLNIIKFIEKIEAHYASHN